MLARIRKAQENNEGGFTLIELLVVMVIIGILAAIAIPSFLAQRDKGYQTAEKSDLKHFSIAAESLATEQDGKYTGLTLATAITNGYVASSGVTIGAVVYNATATTTDDAYCLTATSTKTTTPWYFDSQLGVVQKAKPAKC